MMGDGCGIELTDGTVVAPFDAKVTAAFLLVMLLV